jgi:menaquinone-dependent protoporphyrinogen oxidase
MTVLVCHASRHGSTAEIAERLAASMRNAGLDVDCRAVAEVGEVDRYDAFVVGAAAYMFHWLKDATRFVRRNQSVLSERPVWLFSSGPLGTDLVDDQGRDVFESSRPKEFDELETLITPIETRIFFGKWDPDAPPIGFAERFTRMMPAARDALPSGDFRDWDSIDAWGQEIAQRLGQRSSIEG